MPDQTTLDLDQVRADLNHWQERTALPGIAVQAAHTLAGHVPALLDALERTQIDCDEARTALDATRRHANQTDAALRQQLVTALGRDDDRTTPLADYIAALTYERDQARADLAEAHTTIRDLVHDLTANASRAQQGYAAAIQVLRGVHQRTGSPAANWAADYLTADPDRESPAATVRTPADQVTDAMAHGAAAGLAALRQETGR